MKRIPSNQKPLITPNPKQSLSQSNIKPPSRVINQVHKKSIKSIHSSHTDWNELWCTSKDPLSIYHKFMKQCKKTAVNIIEELPLSQKEYMPSTHESPIFNYCYDGISYTLHCFTTGKDLRDDGANNIILYSQQSYNKTKR